MKPTTVNESILMWRSEWEGSKDTPRCRNYMRSRRWAKKRATKLRRQALKYGDN